ncbi:crotonobetainyl-CoA:carnitine CoA-transferase CaiB-like acyl-CoA transferase [Mycobacterium sp. MAA66]
MDAPKTDIPFVPDADTIGVLHGLRVVELADERAEYVGMLLAGMGADVVKVEPPGGSPTRSIGPFVGDSAGPDRSIFFAMHNRAKQSVVVDLDDPDDTDRFAELVGAADIFLDSTDAGFLDDRGLADSVLAQRFPHLIRARMTAFGDSGPWSGFKGSDLVHLALGGPMMNCGYDPEPSGRYDLPPIAPQLWQSTVIAGEQLVIGVLAAVVHQGRTGQGQAVTCAIHEAVAKSTELDLMNWVMRRAPMYRQTCRHAAEKVSALPTIAQTKDGRWILVMPVGAKDHARIREFLARYGIEPDDDAVGGSDVEGRAIPGSSPQSGRDARLIELVQRLAHKFCYDNFPWQEAQEAGIACSPLRKPHENVADPHWAARGTFAEIEHPELGATLTYPVRKWLSTAPGWRAGRRAPLLGEDTARVWTDLARTRPRPAIDQAVLDTLVPRAPHQLPMPLEGVRVLDFTWFLASAGGTRFLSAFGAECIKVEWKANPDTRVAAMAPVGGRAARDAADGPLPGVTDPDMGGQFNNKNPGKRGLSLNVRHPRGLEIARKLVALSDIVAEGFSPGVMERWGLGYDRLRQIRGDIIYAQQSGMGTIGKYGRYRAVGPIAAALSGVSEMSGLPEPAMPAGWGYSYLDWIGAYSFSAAMLAALRHRDRTGEGQWIDASQTESGIFVAGGAILDWSANGRPWSRTGNASSDGRVFPHGVYPCRGDDRWLAISCSTDEERRALAKVIGSAGTEQSLLRSAPSGELDEQIGQWVSAQDAYPAMYQLQSAGVPAGVCQDAQDRCDTDPQLRHMNWLTEVTGTKIGRWPVAEVPARLSATPAHLGGTLDRGAPCYGEDNEWVLGELLGYGSREIAELADDGVI